MTGAHLRVGFPNLTFPKPHNDAIETNISESIQQIVKPQRRRKTVNDETVDMGGYGALIVAAAACLIRR